MSFVRAALVIAVLSAAVALAVGILSRTPAEVRRAEPPSDATDPSQGARFTDEQVARHGAYRAPTYLALALSFVLEVSVLLVLARAGAYRIVERLPGGWATRAAVFAIVVTATLFVARLPLGYVRGFAMGQAWGLSTQDLGGWLSDAARALGVAAVLAVVSAIAFFGVVRWQPRLWWLWGWGAFTVLTALLTFLWPVVIAPLFNRFTPLEDAALRQRIVALAADAGVNADRVLVADASKRTTTENAYVAGLGETKRVVLYDTLLAEADEDEVAFVVAHELGHEAEDHVLKNVVLASAGLFVGFAALAWLGGRPGFWSWGGAGGVSDVRALPLLLLVATVMGVIALPLQSAVSRRFEARADEIAVRLTDDPSTAVRAFRRLAFSNLADLRPPDAAVALAFSHPPIPDRIRAALEDTGR
ncbi:MAG: M48 family metallopeptidase [Actinomycetota bacterium]